MQKQSTISTPFQAHASHRISITAKCYLLFLAQAILIMYMYVEATTDEEMVSTMATPADQISTILGRFCCAFIAHITLTSESM